MPNRSPRNCGRDSKVNQRINEAVEKIKKQFNVEKIILFGSYARGDNTPHSTINLLIICRTNFPFLDRIKITLNIVRGEPPIEPLLYTPDEIELLTRRQDGFMASVFSEGKTIYRASSGAR